MANQASIAQARILDADGVPVAGALEFQRADGERQTLAILQCFVKNQGAVWSFAVDYLQRFLVEQLADTSPQTESPHGYFL